VEKAKYDLAKVFKLVDARKIDFSMPNKSLNAVVAVYQDTNKPLNIPQAEEFICTGIKTLTEKNFAGSQLQWGSVVVDKYGLVYDSRSWFVKFAIGDDGRLDEISFHPTKEPMTTLGGIKIPKGVQNEK